LVSNLRPTLCLTAGSGFNIDRDNLTVISCFDIRSLTLTQLEDLGEVLLDFTGLGDLEIWLDRTTEESPNNDFR
jgi:hypothetical protein